MIQEISIDLLDPNPFQPRQNEDGLEELAADIAARGLIHPPVARAVNGRYQLACGHRRVAACRSLGWETIRVDVRDNLSDQDLALMAWSENEARRALNPLERAEAIRRMMETFGWTQEQAGQYLGLARSTVANILRLLDLRPEVQDALRAGRISERQALALAPLSELQWEQTGGWVHKKVWEILEGKRQASSDEIRDLMRSAKEEASRSLSSAVFDQSECAECPYKKVSRCFNVECFDQKTKAEREKALLAVQQETGIPRWEENGSEPVALMHSAVQKARERQCPNLRLIPARWFDTRPEYVCALGRECQCAKEADREFQEEIQRKNAERDALIARLTNQLSEAMCGLDDRVLRTILAAIAPGTNPSDDLPSRVARVLAALVISNRNWPEAEKVLRDWEE